MRSRVPSDRSPCSAGATAIGRGDPASKPPGSRPGGGTRALSRDRRDPLGCRWHGPRTGVAYPRRPRATRRAGDPEPAGLRRWRRASSRPACAACAENYVATVSARHPIPTGFVVHNLALGRAAFRVPGRPDGNHLFLVTAPALAAVAGGAISGRLPRPARIGVLALSAYATKMGRSLVPALMSWDF